MTSDLLKELQKLQSELSKKAMSFVMTGQYNSKEAQANGEKMKKVANLIKEESNNDFEIWMTDSQLKDNSDKIEKYLEIA